MNDKIVKVLRELLDDYDTLAQRCRELEAERAELVRLRAECREAAKDAARLDWIADQFKTCTVYMDCMHPWRPTGYKLRELNGPTFRLAIDAAMEPKP